MDRTLSVKECSDALGRLWEQCASNDDLEEELQDLIDEGARLARRKSGDEFWIATGNYAVLRMEAVLASRKMVWDDEYDEAMAALETFERL
jgi:hypothetical protein